MSIWSIHQSRVWLRSLLAIIRSGDKKGLLSILAAAASILAALALMRKMRTNKNKARFQQNEILPQHIEKHRNFMREAIEMGELALRTDETPVGCVFVHKDEIIGRGMNDTNRSMNGTRHAEFVAIEKILAKHPQSIFAETDLYVTVEPCIMCASALRQYGIRAVYYGCNNDKFGGTSGVMNIHSDPGVDPSYPAYGGIFREEAIMLLRRFYVQENSKAPDPHRKGTRELKTEILPATAAKISIMKKKQQSHFSDSDKENQTPV